MPTQMMKRAEQQLPATADPNLTATVLTFLADMMRARSGARLDNVATLQRLVASLSEELAEHLRADADEHWTVTEAIAKVGGTTVNMRTWIRKHGIGHKDRGRWLVSKAKLQAFLAHKHGGVLPGHLAEAFR
jgi:hypothetical protein